jgi:hypothetical protein
MIQKNLHEQAMAYGGLTCAFPELGGLGIGSPVHSTLIASLPRLKRNAGRSFKVVAKTKH